VTILARRVGFATLADLSVGGCGETPEASEGEPTMFRVDAAGETSRLLRLDPPAWTIVEVASLPDGGRGLALDHDHERLIWVSRDCDVIQRGTRGGTEVETLPLAGHDSA
jgi:hypothetical protein